MVELEVVVASLPSHLRHGVCIAQELKVVRIQALDEDTEHVDVAHDEQVDKHEDDEVGCALGHAPDQHRNVNKVIRQVAVDLIGVV